MDEMFSLREGLNFDISKLSRRRSSKLEFERQEEIDSEIIRRDVVTRLMCVGKNA